MVRKRYSSSWVKNTDTEIFQEEEDVDLNIYRDMAMMDTKFAIKKLLYDSDIILSWKEISKIIGMNEYYTRYILRYMVLYDKTIMINKETGIKRYYIDKNPKRKTESREKRYRYKTIA